VSPDLWLNDAISLDIHWTIGLKSQDGFQSSRKFVSPDLWLNDAISLDIHWTIGLKSQDGFQRF
jgi:multidrug transporter EmrE-like cation transporter